MVSPPLHLAIQSATIFSLALACRFLPNPAAWTLLSWLSPKLNFPSRRRRASSAVLLHLRLLHFTWLRRNKAVGDLAAIIGSWIPLLFLNVILSPTSLILSQESTDLQCSPSWTFRKVTIRCLFLRRTSRRPPSSPLSGCSNSFACPLASETLVTRSKPDRSSARKIRLLIEWIILKLYLTGN